MHRFMQKRKNVLLYSGPISGMILSPIFLAKTLFPPFILSFLEHIYVLGMGMQWGAAGTSCPHPRVTWTRKEVSEKAVPIQV